MPIRDLILFLEAGAPYEARISLAAALAGRFCAYLTTVMAPIEPCVEIAEGFAIGPAAVNEVLLRREAETESAMTPIRSALAAALETLQAPHTEMRAPTGEPAQDLAARARCHDLAIIRRPPTHDHASHLLAELVSMGSGTACLVVPDAPMPSTALDRIVIGWSGSREAKRAVQDAMPLLQRAHLVRIVVVDGESGTTPDSEARDEVLRYLAGHGVRARLDRVDAKGEDAGSALLRQCAALKADLLVMGAYSHSRTKELVLGGATRTILARASLPVLMSH